MVNTKNAKNDPRVDTGMSNPQKAVFQKKLFKNERSQGMWPKFQSRNIITGRNIKESFRPKYRQKMMEPVRVLGWNALMPLLTSVYSNLVRYFYCNLEAKNLENFEFTIYSYMQGKHIVLNPTVLSQIIDIPNEGELIFIDKPSQLKNHVDKAEMNEMVSIRGTVGANQNKDLKKAYIIFHRFISYNVTHKHGHYGQASTMDNFIIYRSATKDPLNLNYIILREVADIRNRKNRSLPYSALLTKIFEYFRVSFRNQTDKLHGLHGTYIDRLGDNYEQLYAQ